MGQYSEAIAPLVAALTGTQPATTPENTPIPGGGSWRWDYDLLCWVANTPATPVPQPE